MRAYKLFRKRKDGTLGSLFINRSQRIPIDWWLPAESHPTKGFAVRPGWHVTARPHAPHISMAGRVWCEVEILEWYEFQRPASQGGLWYIAKWLRVIRELDDGPYMLESAENAATGQH